MKPVRYRGAPRNADIDRCTEFIILGFNTNNSGCEFDVGQTCVATLIVEANYTNNNGTVTYDWTFTPMADVTDHGDHTDRIYTLHVTGNSNVDVEVQLTATDSASNTSTYTETITVAHTPKVT